MFVCCQYPLWNFSFAASTVDLYKSVSHITLHMSRTLLRPREKSEDEDSDFFVINDDEDNHLRQEYD